MSILEERGYFWWPDEAIPEGRTMPESHVAGILKINDDGRAILELNSPLRRKDQPRERVIVAAYVDMPGLSICGLLKGERRNVYLYDLSGDNFLNTHYFAQNCLVGNGASTIGSVAPLFDELIIYLKGFEGWLCLGSIKFEVSEQKTTVEYERKVDDVFESVEGKFSLRFAVNSHATFPGTNNVSLTEMAFWHYYPAEPKSIFEMKIKYRVIEDFFILMADSEYCMEWPSIKLVGTDKFYTYYFSRNMTQAEAPKWHECCTNYIQLREKLGVIFSEWENKLIKFGSGFYLYLASRRGLTRYIEDRFMNFMSGLETFHRRSAPHTMPNENLQKKIQRMLAQITAKKDQDWFKVVLKRSHICEPSLSERLFATLAVLPLNFEKERLQKFCESCATARNELAHFGGQREQNTDHNSYTTLLRSLERKSEALSYLYHVLLLHEIGVEEKYIKEWVLQGFNSYRIKSAMVDVDLFDKSILQASA